MEHDLYQIGELAKLAKVNIQTIRYYERINLLKPRIRRNKSGARLYNQESFNTLSFIKNAQSLGFQLQEIKELLLFRVETGKCVKVRKSAEDKLVEIQQRIKDLKVIEKKLKALLKTCLTSTADKHCAIIRELEL